MKTLFKNTCILVRKSKGYETIRNGYLAVDGAFISYVGSTRPDGEFDEEKDMSGKLLMPGLVNTHCHTSMVLLRGVGSNLNLQDWLFNSIFPVEAKLRDEDIIIGSELAFMELIASGTTSVTDMYFKPYLTCEIAENCGIKLNVNDAVTCIGDFNDKNLAMVERAVSFQNKWNNRAEGRIRTDVAVHSEYLNSEEALKTYFTMSKGSGLGFHLHLSETVSEHRECVARHGMTPAAYFESLGYLDEFPTYCAHCVHVTDGDLEIMKKHGVTIAHNPSSNMKLGSGFAPIRKALEMGISVALGTDGAASNNNLNMFEELHLASLIHKGNTMDPTTLNTDQLIDMATVAGAKAQGRTDTGVLESGKRADIIALDLDQPHLMPAYDIPALVCYAAQGSDVCMTMIDGKIVYENGVFKTMDRERIMKDAKSCAKYLLNMQED